MIPRRVIILACAVTLVSAFFSFYIYDHPRVDAKAYDKIGWNFAQGRGYVEEESLAATPRLDDAIIRVGPGYEFFLAGVYSIVGHRYWVVWLLHAVLRGASVILIYLIAEMLFASAGVSFLAAIFFGFSPDLIVINSFLLTETLFIFLIIAAVYATLLYNAKKYSSTIIFFVGILWALAILVRPIALLPFFIVFGNLLWYRTWKNLAILCIAPVLLIGSWSTYATYRYGSFILTTTAGGYDLWVGNNIDATGGFEKSPEIQALRNTIHSVELEKISRKKYFEFLFGHPFKFIELQFRKLAMYIDILRPGGVWFGLYSHKWLLLCVITASLVGTTIFFVFGLAGFVVLIRGRTDILSRMFLAIALVAPLGVVPIIVETRYRYPFFPFLAISAAFFLTQKSFDKKLISKILLILMVFAGYDLWSNWNILIEKLVRILTL